MDARAEIMLEEYTNVLLIESETALKMANADYLPALAADLKAYEGTPLAGDRPAVYAAVATETASCALYLFVSRPPNG